jgi:hypothetical protein
MTALDLPTFCCLYYRMAKKSIKTLAGLQRALNARNRELAPLYKRPYILQPALTRHLDQFEQLEQIEDAAARYQAFRRLPALEYELAAVNGSLTPKQRESLAQRDRATRPRVRLTDDGETLKTIIFDILTESQDPWRQKAKQYWLPVIDRLRQLGRNPTLTPDPSNPANENLEYDRIGGRRSLRQGQFANIVSEVRRCLSRSQLTASG